MAQKRAKSAPQSGQRLFPNDSPVPLESVLCTEELTQRPSRLADYEAENRALVALAQSLADSPRTILQSLAQTILELLQADSAGVSLLTDDEKSFHWPAIAGMWKPHIGGGTPRDFGPCGDVLDRNAPLLFRRFEQRYTYFQPVTPSTAECLLVPFHIEGKAVGTIWAIAHDDRRKFDAEDLRQLVSLGRFASSAYQTVASLIRLERSEIHYRRLFEAARDGVVFIDPATARILDANPFMTELLGYAREELLGKELFEIGLLKDEETSRAAFRELLEKGAIRYDNLPLETKTGVRREVEFVSNLYQEGSHRIIQCNIRDITARKLADEALRAADRHKNEFLAMLAHELRNPLAPISNAVQIMRHTRGDEQVLDSTSAMMERQVGQMVRLVDDLLDVSRISRGKIELKRGRIELASAVNHAVEAARPHYESMGHELTVTLPSKPVYLNGDPMRLAQVVGNLLNNACKFTERGGGIWLTVQQEGEQAVVRVRDNGIGIAADQLPRIFDMFTQLDTSLERTQTGLGIGLTLVKTLVEMHGGTVEVYSGGLGEGSEFLVRLPVVESSTLPAPELTSSKLIPPTGRRILVVDDNRDSAVSLAMLLKITGNETHTAYDGLEAVEAAATFRPDVVLLDIGLPKLNGYEAARRMREQPWGKGMVLVALTGWGQDEDRERSREAGFNGHLVKPVDLPQLQELLKRPGLVGQAAGSGHQ